MPTHKTHYVARIVVTRVTKTLINTPGSRTAAEETEANRVVTEVASIVVNAGTVTLLSNRVANHMELVVDGEDEE